MKRTIRSALLVAVAGLAAGCGGAGPSPTAGQAPAQAIQLAAAQLGSRSFRMAYATTLTADTSGATGPVAAGIAAGSQQSGTQSGHDQFQDATHFSATTSVAHHPFELVVYGTAAYVSVDGRNYQSAPFLSSLVGQFNASQVRDYAAHLQNARDDGTSTQGGVASEKYDSTLDSTYLNTLLNKLLSSMLGTVTGPQIPAATINSLLAALHYQEITLTWYIDKSTGRLVRQVTQGAISIDVGRFVSAIQGASGGASTVTGSGTVLLHENYDAQFSGWGDNIVVTKPNATGTLTPQQFGQLLLTVPATS